MQMQRTNAISLVLAHPKQSSTGLMPPQLDYEPDLRELEPHVTWKDCSGHCVLGSLESRKGVIIVPSNYDDPADSQDLKVTFWRFTSSREIVPTIHLFLLAGGPGNSGRAEDGVAKALVKFFGPYGLAVYLLDPRGLGESSPFLRGYEGASVTPLRHEIIRSGPFPVAHLTARNSALDVGMITIALQKEPDYDPTSTWHISGGSYGALLANQAVLLAPNLFASVYLTGVPRMRGSPLPSGRGIAENCALNDYCREQAGGNVWEDVQRSIKSALHPETNACTRALSSVINKYSESTTEHRHILLTYLFRDLMHGRSTGFKDTFVQQSQVIFLFLRATSDCVDPGSYVKEVLVPMLVHLRKDYLTGGAKELARGAEEALEKSQSRTAQLFDRFVNTIGILDIEFYSGPPRPTRPNDYDLHDDVVLAHAYAGRYEAYKEYLREMVHTVNVPLCTNTTRVFVEQGRMDLHTTYQSTKDAFDSMVAPEKTWYLVDSLGHQTIMDGCWFQRMGTFLGFTGQSSPEACLAHLNEHKKSDWTFETNPELARWWKYIRKTGPAAPAAQQVLPVPNYVHVRTPASQIPPDVSPPLPPPATPRKVPFRPYPGTFAAIPLFLQIAIVFSGISVLLVAALASYYYFVRRSPQPATGANRSGEPI